eukprot:343151_1
MSAKTIDEYIVYTFQLFVEKKNNITIDFWNLSKYSNKSILKSIIEADIKERSQDDSETEWNQSNLVSHNIFKLFPNVERMDIFTTDDDGTTIYGFNLIHFLEIISSPFGWAQITIKAYRIRIDKSEDTKEQQSNYKYMKDDEEVECRFIPSWLYNAWNSNKLIQQKYNQNKIKAHMKEFNDYVKNGVNAEDWLILCRDDVV